MEYRIHKYLGSSIATIFVLSPLILPHSEYPDKEFLLSREARPIGSHEHTHPKTFNHINIRPIDANSATTTPYADYSPVSFSQMGS